MCAGLRCRTRGLSLAGAYQRRYPIAAIGVMSVRVAPARPHDGWDEVTIDGKTRCGESSAEPCSAASRTARCRRAPSPMERTVLAEQRRDHRLAYAGPLGLNPSGHPQMQTRLPARSASVQCDGA